MRYDAIIIQEKKSKVVDQLAKKNILILYAVFHTNINKTTATRWKKNRSDLTSNTHITSSIVNMRLQTQKRGP